ncbi:MAG: family 10 glycosylhydrolase [Candidatus Eisenbacteria bacterium]|nr:family 10 glycosylhydrolase [Candidatus Eisenbacteria bacterium]
MPRTLAPLFLTLVLLVSTSAAAPSGDSQPLTSTHPDPAAPLDSVPAPAAAPLRALWLIRDHLSSPAATRGAVTAACDLGATDLFLQIRGRGDAFYRSALVPPPVMLRHQLRGDSLAWDPLAVALEEAHRRGVRLHAWFNVNLVWAEPAEVASEHLLRAHPDWVLQLADGRSMTALSVKQRRDLGVEGIFLDPRPAPARAHLLAVVEELLLRYPVDGLHWDYVRAPRTPFAPDSVVTMAGAISTFVYDAATIARAVRPGLLLSAAVFPDPAEAFAQVHQDWPRWLADGAIDQVVPMSYTQSTVRLDDWRRRALHAGVGETQLVTGLGVYKLAPEALRTQLAWTGAHSPGGVALFSLADLVKSPAAAAAVREFWRSPASAPRAP